MSCGCGGGGRRRTRPAAGYEYVVTTPDGIELAPMLSALEARRAVRQSGGGTIRRREATPPA